METLRLEDWLILKVGNYLNLSTELIDVDIPLADFGIDSAMSLSLCADLQCERGIEVDTTIVWDYPTISALAAHLEAVPS